jgi:tetratricopeptide (TPR) repeat protein
MSLKKYYILLIFLLQGFVCAQSPGHALYKAGEALFKQNKLEEAIDKFNLALVEEPSNYLYHSAKGLALSKGNQDDLALTAFQKAIYYKEDYAKGYQLIGQVYLKQGSIDKAINYYNLAFKTESELSGKVQFKSDLVLMLIENERYQTAEMHVNELLALAPYNASAHFLSGELNLALGDNSQAIKGYKKALEYNKDTKPESIAAIYYGLGKALYQNGDTENAKKAWAKANYGKYKRLISEDMSRMNPDYFYKIGVSYYLSGDLNEAVTQLKKAVEMKPDFVNAHKYLAIVNDKRDLTSEANLHFTKAVQAEKDSAKQADIYLIWLASQVENENFAGAITSAEKVLKVYPQNAKAWLLKSQAEKHLGRYTQAISSAEKGLNALNTTDQVKKSPFYFVIGSSARMTGNAAKAKEALTNAQFGNIKYAAKHELDLLNGVIVE